MPEKVIIHNSSYDLVENKGRLYIIPHPKASKLTNVLAVIFTSAIIICLVLFPPVGIFLLLFLFFFNSLKKGLNG